MTKYVYKYILTNMYLYLSIMYLNSIALSLSMIRSPTLFNIIYQNILFYKHILLYYE